MSLDFDALGLYEHIYIYMNIYEHVLTAWVSGFWAFVHRTGRFEALGAFWSVTGTLPVSSFVVGAIWLYSGLTYRSRCPMNSLTSYHVMRLEIVPFLDCQSARTFSTCTTKQLRRSAELCLHRALWCPGGKDLLGKCSGEVLRDSLSPWLSHLPSHLRGPLWTGGIQSSKTLLWPMMTWRLSRTLVPHCTPLVTVSAACSSFKGGPPFGSRVGFVLGQEAHAACLAFHFIETTLGGSGTVCILLN